MENQEPQSENSSPDFYTYDDLIDDLSELKYDKNSVCVLTVFFNPATGPYFNVATRENTELGISMEEVVGALEFTKAKLIKNSLDIMDEIDQIIEDQMIEEDFNSNSGNN